MRAIAEWLLGRRGPRVLLLVLLFPLPLLTVASAAIVVLVGSRAGWREAAIDGVLALALLVALVLVAGGSWPAIGAGAGLTWLVAALLGQLRRVGSLTLAVQAAVLLGVAGAVSFMAWNPNPQAYWEQVLTDLAARARAAGLDIGPGEMLPGAAQIMTGMMSASAVVSAVAALFLGSWAAGPARGRSFPAEFRELRMGRVLGGLTVVTAALLVTGLRPVADDLLVVLGCGFLFQGLAVVHWLAAQRQWPAGWALLLYMPLVLLPAVAGLELLALTALGLIDNGYSLRRGGGKVV